MTDTTDLIQRLKAFRGLWLGDGMHPSVERQKVIDALEQQAADAHIDKKNLDCLYRTIDELTAEAEQQAAQIEAQDAEITRLNAAWDHAFRRAVENGGLANNYKAELSALRADAERLRGALVTGASMLEMGCNALDMAESMRRCAALRQGQPT